MKIQKKNWGGGVRCERRIKVFVKIQKKYIYFGGSGGGEVGVGGGGEVRVCERRIEYL